MIVGAAAVVLTAATAKTSSSSFSGRLDGFGRAGKSFPSEQFLPFSTRRHRPTALSSTGSRKPRSLGMGDRGTAFTDGVTQSTDCLLWRMPPTFVDASLPPPLRSQNWTILRPDRRSSQWEAADGQPPSATGALRCPVVTARIAEDPYAEHRRVVWWLGFANPRPSRCADILDPNDHRGVTCCKTDGSTACGDVSKPTHSRVTRWAGLR